MEVVRLQPVSALSLMSFVHTWCLYVPQPVQKSINKYIHIEICKWAYISLHVYCMSCIICGMFLEYHVWHTHACTQYTYTYTQVSTHENALYIYVHIHILYVRIRVQMYMYLYIYIEREIERERVKERERDWERETEREIQICNYIYVYMWISYAFKNCSA